MATRRAQPYRRRSQTRGAGRALRAMTAGTTLHGYNPQNEKRKFATLSKRRKRAVRRRT